MNKFIPADKLIAEIERRIGICKRVTEDERNEEDMKRYYQGKVVALEEIRHLADSLQQEQPDLPSGEEVMTMCNQILIDWVKEGKTQEEKEQREQAHLRFFELYDEYLMLEQPEVDLEKLVNEEFASRSQITEYGPKVMYNRAELYQLIKRMALVFNARKEE